MTAQPSAAVIATGQKRSARMPSGLERDVERLPLTRLDDADPGLFAELMQAVERVASRAGFVDTAEVEAFEAEFAAYCGTAHAIGVSSGTDALALSLRALGVRAGDEVIVPTNSFIATAEAVTLVGATPRLVDVDPVSHTLTAEIVERNLTPHTRCVIPVHLYGRTAEVDRVVDVAHGRGICVVEDACQAHGAVYKDMRVGSIGDAGCFSFYPAKNLGAWGDGGAVVTNDPALADRVRLMRSHGERPRHRHLLCGTTARLDALQAAVLRVKLPLLDGWNEGRRLVAARLSELLAQSSIETPAPLPAGHDHVFHQYVIRSDRRDRLREHLDRAGVATTIHYPSPIHLTEAYGYLGITRGRLPVAERQATRICSLPIFPSMSASELERVVHAVRSFAGPP